ncbi:MAG TPA: glycosyltransferase family 2 protein [Terriglobales bacterium]|nr:glycosyltransferase family 2 protein [Terriglobales bacterium]
MPHPAATRATVSVIVPARNEEASLGACLESLLRLQGVAFEIIVVDDGSIDLTREIAGSFSAVKVVGAAHLPPGWSGKTNAMLSGARESQGEWLLFTDADTVHLPGSLARALQEAKQHGAALLSYSPEQEVHGFWQKAVMPVIFAELAASYRPSQVSSPAFPVAAANGQYLLISREAYEAVGGHAAVAGSLLEDVALARAVKASGRRIFFRFGGDAVRTRMYRSFAELREGWTKNLALLFPSAGRLATMRLLEFVLITGSVGELVNALLHRRSKVAFISGVLAAVLIGAFAKRIRKAHFPRDSNMLALLGLPLFSSLLLRSRALHKKGNIIWKGRRYTGSATPIMPQSPSLLDGTTSWST